MPVGSEPVVAVAWAIDGVVPCRPTTFATRWERRRVTYAVSPSLPMTTA